MTIDLLCNEARESIWDINLSSNSNEECVYKINNLRNIIKRLENQLVLDEHRRGRSWEQIGKQMNISRQAAWEKYKEL